MRGKSALIGYTGFVGGTLDRQFAFDDRYNSANIREIVGKAYEVVVCAGTRAEKWKINRDPAPDVASQTILLDAMGEATIQELILISTIDVYPVPINVDEDSPIDPELSHPYGKHRYQLERSCVRQFDSLVVRLPGLFGEGIKKNVIYDLLNNNNVDQVHADGVYQFYSLAHLWRDIETARQNRLKLVNFATQPVSVREFARTSFGIDFTNRPPNSQPPQYNMKSKYAGLYGGRDGYLYPASEVLADLVRFVHGYAKR